jgi:hypothetical protein
MGPDALGADLARRLRDGGADAILDALDAGKLPGG